MGHSSGVIGSSKIKLLSKIQKSLLSNVFFFFELVLDLVIELSKLNQKWYAVSHVYIESRIEEVLAIVFLWKKLGFRTEICDYFV